MRWIWTGCPGAASPRTASESLPANAGAIEAPEIAKRIVIAMARATIATRAAYVLPLCLKAEPALLLQI